jgi:hypothetical protein
VGQKPVVRNQLILAKGAIQQPPVFRNLQA